MIKTRFISGLMLCLPLAAYAEPATTVIDTPLSDKPVFGARAIKTIPANTAVEVVTNKRLWCEVDYQNNKLWAKCFNLRFTNPPKRDEATSDDDSSRGVTHTIGIRGLNASDLEAAEPSEAQYEKLRGYQVDADTATEVAKQKKLSSHSIDHLDKTDSEKPSGEASDQSLEGDNEL